MPVAQGVASETSALNELESMARDSADGSFDIDKSQAAQFRYLNELKRQGNNWLVTDFVTLGSPLAHAPFLMARKSEDFDRKRREREFPICPPVLEDISVNTNLRFGFLSHTLYWRFSKKKSDKVPSWIKRLRDAVKICQNPISVELALAETATDEPTSESCCSNNTDTRP